MNLQRAPNRQFLNSISHAFSRLIFLLACLLIIFGSKAVEASTFVVPSGGNLQAAIDTAQYGDTIVVEAGGVFTGPFYFSSKSGGSGTDADYITIQSSRVGELQPGVRVSPGQVPSMARLVSGGNFPVIKTYHSAHHFRFIGIEFAPESAQAVVFNLIELGDDGGGGQNTLDKVPHHFVFDRCYVHAFDGQDVVRGFALNSSDTEITNCHISNFKSMRTDSQAILSWNTPGRFRIINNYLEAATETLQFGGGGGCGPLTQQGILPSDIEVRRNTLTKRMEWRGVWGAKNLFEIKYARRVVVDGNLMENNWADGQVGFAVQLTVRNEGGVCNLNTIEDVTITNNLIRHSSAGINILGTDLPHVSGQATRILIRNNLLLDLSSGAYGGVDGFLQVIKADRVTADHNTADSMAVNSANQQQSTNLVYTNNIAQQGPMSNSQIALFFPGAVIRRNVNFNDALNEPEYGNYPSDNWYPDTAGQVGFVEYATHNLRLNTASQFKGQATDGSDVGCDIDALIAALGGTAPPTPTPTPFPTPTPNPTPTATPTPNPTPTPGPVTELGQSILRVKRDGQNLSNQLASSGGTSAPGGASALVMDPADTEALQLIITRIQTAFTQFNDNSGIFPQAMRIRVELTAALQSALLAQSSSLQGDMAAVRTHLRDAITHLELTGVLIARPTVTNPIDVASYVVRQHFLDYLDREPDQPGNDFWIGQFAACGTDARCFEEKRIHVSAAFFLSIEFQQTGYFVHRLYRSSYARVPLVTEFMPDNTVLARGIIVGTEGWQARLTANKNQFLQSWVLRADFNARYGSLTNEQYVNSLIANLGVAITSQERDALILDLANGATRATVLGRVAENDTFSRSELNKAFVLMEYFGYLRRDPDPPGFNFWLNKLNQFDGNYQNADMVKAFVASQEYRERFAL